MSNEELAVLVKQGDREAAARLWEQTYRLIYALLSRYFPMCGASVEPDDLRQAGYFAMLRAAEAYDPGKGFAFTSYLTAHSANVARETLGFTNRRTKLPPVARSLSEPVGDDGAYTLADTLADPDAGAPFERVEDTLYNAGLHAALEECLGRLPDEQADALRERYYHGLSVADMAASRGIPPHIVRGKVDRALIGMQRGENRRRLREYQQDIISRSCRYGGYQTFAHTGYSSVEWAVERIYESGLTL